ncbi:FKBP-type peptidyl-prolyl cis-trans isomerase [Paraneptunicella aestuarii]|uniref:FKBP-type peptidyl-prolyl cis-trans isomerase n=1 Tax=Paraneptunicella aestuarii TaxID=2831148 RepID=UPI001E3AC53C|nr:FKBP-type peptidyl-prolyl cis-trans isomerase [Paraneptunicella aestuarii]UAA38892.1 FKBP-type peptidyl-prolyl cis-trans isomerase [Paraneptunicella aestuarii]
MKKSLTVVALSVVLGLTACQQEKPDPLAVEQIKMETEDQKNSYALGANIGTFLKQQIDTHKDLGITLDDAIILNGIKAAMQDKSQYTEQEVQEQLHKLQVSFREKNQQKQEAKAEDNLKEGMAYLEENKKREGVIVTDSGLQYEVITMGDGEKPSEEDTVKVHYHGTLINGEVFDSSVDRGEPAVFPLNRVISGWTEGVQLMPVGSKFRFHIPAELAYGQRNAGKISPNSTLIFDVELLGIESKGTE